MFNEGLALKYKSRSIGNNGTILNDRASSINYKASFVLNEVIILNY